MHSLFREVMATWQTDEIRRNKPTPVEEAKGGLHILEQSLWNAVPAYLRKLNSSVTQVLFHFYSRVLGGFVSFGWLLYLFRMRCLTPQPPPPPTIPQVSPGSGERAPSLVRGQGDWQRQIKFEK